MQLLRLFRSRMQNLTSNSMKLLILLVFFPFGKCVFTPQTEAKYDAWKNSAVEFLRVGFHGILYRSLLAEKNYLHLNVSHECKNALTDLKNGIESSELWALKMLDASGKPIEGVLDGTVASLGDYDECLSIKAKGATEFDGAYCMIRVHNTIKTNTSDLFGAIDLPDDEVMANRLARVYFAYGACLPSLCSPQEVSTLAQHYLEPYSWQIVSEPFCSTTENRSFHFQRLSFWQKVSLIGWSLALSLLLIVTLADILVGSDSAFVDAISIKRNWNRLWSKEVPEKPCVRLIVVGRFMLMIFEIGLHTGGLGAMFDGFYLIANTEKLLPYIRSPLVSMQLFFSGQSQIFLASGLTSSMAALKLLQSKNVLWSGLKQIVVRYLKFLPIICCTMALQILIPLTASGPAFDHIMTAQAEKCSKHGWTTLAMISNWFWPFNMCIPVFWSISVDFQMYILLVINVVILSKSQRAGIAFALLMSSLGIIIPAYHTYAYNLTIPCLHFPYTLLDAMNGFLLLHFSTHSQLSLYFLPFIALYLRRQGFRLPISKEIGERLYQAKWALLTLASLIHTPWGTWGLKATKLTSTIIEGIRRPLLIFPILIFCMLDEDVGYRMEAKPKDINDNKVNEATKKGPTSPPCKPSYFLALVDRLVGPVYFGHQFFNIWDQLTSRDLLPGDAYSMLTRIFRGYIGCLVLGIIFYLVLAPLANLLEGRPHKSKKSLNKSE